MIDGPDFQIRGRSDAAPLRDGDPDHAGTQTTADPAAAGSNSSSSSAGLRLLLYVAGVTLLVTALSLARGVLMPLAMAALLAFVLSPPVALLERAGLHRLPSVALVLLVALSGIALFGYTLSRQFDDLASHMPQYSVAIRSRLAALREARKGPITQIQESVKEAGQDLDKQEMVKHPPVVDAPGPVRKEVQPVVIVPNQPADADLLRASWQPFVRPAATAGIVLILTIFMLVQHENLLDRLVRLAGPGRGAVTTRTLDQAALHMRRFLFSQSLINAVFGVFITVGLLLIGIPYALLWGVTAGFLRFVPYLGTTIAMLVPAGLALVQSDGWTRTIETLVLFWSAGLSAYVLDPIVNGSRTGTSSFALLLSAIFWTWLWGPAGLLLSTPITLCLVAVGEHVPGMRFLGVLLAEVPTQDSRVSRQQGSPAEAMHSQMRSEVGPRPAPRSIA
jgi:predicted PurR-regulated permease PerM